MNCLCFSFHLFVSFYLTFFPFYLPFLQTFQTLLISTHLSGYVSVTFKGRKGNSVNSLPQTKSAAPKHKHLKTSDLQKLDLKSIELKSSRAKNLFTLEDPSPWASLLASCSGETSMAQDDSLLGVFFLHSGSSKTSVCSSQHQTMLFLYYRHSYSFW